MTPEECAIAKQALESALFSDRVIAMAWSTSKTEFGREQQQRHTARAEALEKVIALVEGQCQP